MGVAESERQSMFAFISFIFSGITRSVILAPKNANSPTSNTLLGNTMVPVRSILL